MIGAPRMALEPATAEARTNGLRVLVLDCSMATAKPSLYGGAWSIGPWDLHPLALLFVLSGTLMISKTLRIPKL
jgi:hypothetical protein